MTAFGMDTLKLLTKSLVKNEYNKKAEVLTRSVVLKQLGVESLFFPYLSMHIRHGTIVSNMRQTK